MDSGAPRALESILIFIIRVHYFLSAVLFSIRSVPVLIASSFRDSHSARFWGDKDHMDSGAPRPLESIVIFYDVHVYSSSSESGTFSPLSSSPSVQSQFCSFLVHNLIFYDVHVYSSSSESGTSSPLSSSPSVESWSSPSVQSRFLLRL
jgi:hypothetical protein